MKTDDLITALAADLPNRPTPVSRAVAYALATSLPLITVLLMVVAPPRPGLVGMLLEPKIIVKFVFTFGLFAAGLWLATRITRPGVETGPARYALAAVLAMLAGAVLIELSMVPQAAWAPAMLGSYGVPCLALIGLLSIAPFAALMMAFRAGAPDSPALAGAVAGLVAGSLAATFYATHCTEDSALFVALWYVTGILAVTALGAVVGRYALRW